MSQSIQAKAHQQIFYARWHNLLIPSPKCLSCGKWGMTVAHHEDYTRPLEVIWLCFCCHSQLHLSKHSQIKHYSMDEMKRRRLAWQCYYWKTREQLQKDGLIRQAEAARLLGLSRARIRQMIQEGKLTSVLVGGVPFVLSVQIEHLCRERATGVLQGGKVAPSANQAEADLVADVKNSPGDGGKPPSGAI